MPSVVQLLNNKKAFMKNVLDTKNGEELIAGQAEGYVDIVDDYATFKRNTSKMNKIKKFPMTFFLTNRRIVVYYKNSYLKKDKFAQLPFSDIATVVLELDLCKNSIFYVANFIPKKRSDFQGIRFKVLVDNIYEVNAFYSLVRIILRKSHARFVDRVNKEELQGLNI